jgi:hypothetical protein
MKKSILMKNAICHGSGRDRFKRVTGITKLAIEQVEKIVGERNTETVKNYYDGGNHKINLDTFGDDNVVLLAYSHTNYKNQHYKQIVRIGTKYQTHRQINDDDFEVIAIV